MTNQFLFYFRHNEDGSYTYGYEAADGTFKIETKESNGEVKGKYGYVDDTGKIRVVEYGATKYGFAPVGEGITVPPPTLVDESRTEEEPEYQNSYYDAAPAPRPIARPAPRPRPRPQLQPEPEYEPYSPPQQFAPAPVPHRASVPVAVPSSFSSNLEFGPKARASVKSFAPAQAPLRPAPQNFQFAQPAPIEESQDEYEPAPRPVPRPAPRPKITYAHPRPAPQAPPQHFAAAAPSRPVPRPNGPIPRPGGGGVLDQLAKDYALPQGGAAPLHDISFGYY